MFIFIRIKKKSAQQTVFYNVRNNLNRLLFIPGFDVEIISNALEASY